MVATFGAMLGCSKHNVANGRSKREKKIDRERKTEEINTGEKGERQESAVCKFQQNQRQQQRERGARKRERERELKRECRLEGSRRAPPKQRQRTAAAPVHERRGEALGNMAWRVKQLYKAKGGLFEEGGRKPE